MYIYICICIIHISADPRQQQGERVRGPRPGIHVAEATSSVLHCHGVLALRDRPLSEAGSAGRRLHCHGVLALRDRSEQIAFPQLVFTKPTSPGTDAPMER